MRSMEQSIPSKPTLQMQADPSLVQFPLQLQDVWLVHWKTGHFPSCITWLPGQLSFT